MPFCQTGGVRYFFFESLWDQRIVHAAFTRQGGVSPSPWEGLNLGGTVGDDPNRVAENRRKAFQAVERPLESLFDVWQVHGTRVALADEPRLPETPHLKADILLTTNPKVTLLMRFADCVPILLYDPIRRVAGIVHAGWKGTVKKAVSVAVKAMQVGFGSSAGDILATIGPSIGAHHYPVGDEVVVKVQQAFPEESGLFLPSLNGRVYFDLWAANQLLLQQSGVRNIENPQICTACNSEDWFSHRGEKGKTGRFGVLIGLKE